MVDRGRRDFWKDARLHPHIRAQSRNKDGEQLEKGFQPMSWDVICAGGKESFEHTGNRRFRICIENNLPTYIDAKSKHDKSRVVSVIVEAIQESCTQKRGGFVRKDEETGRWSTVGEKVAREKVGHALRDAIKMRKKRLEDNDSRNKKTRNVLATKKRPLKRSSSGPPFNSSTKRMREIDHNDTTTISNASDNDAATTSLIPVSLPPPRPTEVSTRIVFSSDIQDGNSGGNRTTAATTTSGEDQSCGLRRADGYGSDSDDSILVKMAKETDAPEFNLSRETDADAVYHKSLVLVPGLKSEWVPPGSYGFDDEFVLFMTGLSAGSPQKEKNSNLASSRTLPSSHKDSPERRMRTEQRKHNTLGSAAIAAKTGRGILLDDGATTIDARTAKLAHTRAEWICPNGGIRRDTARRSSRASRSNQIAKTRRGIGKG